MQRIAAARGGRWMDGVWGVSGLMGVLVGGCPMEFSPHRTPDSPSWVKHSSSGHSVMAQRGGREDVPHSTYYLHEENLTLSLLFPLSPCSAGVSLGCFANGASRFGLLGSDL